VLFLSILLIEYVTLQRIDGALIAVFLLIDMLLTFLLLRMKV